MVVVMTLELNAGKLLGLFTPIWVLLALSLAVNWNDWQDRPLTLAWVGGLPFAATGLLWSFGRRRWRLELTPTALVHHTLGRTERFEWDRMGEIAVDGAPASPTGASGTTASTSALSIGAGCASGLGCGRKKPSPSFLPRPGTMKYTARPISRPRTSHTHAGVA